MSSARQERHIVYPRGSMGVISPGRRDRCVYRDTVCSPACLEGPAVAVNTAELRGLYTCWGQVQVSWDVFMQVSGRHRGVFVCMHSCGCKWTRSYSKREGLWRRSMMISEMWHRFESVHDCVCACWWATWKHLVQHNHGSRNRLQMCLCVLAPLFVCLWTNFVHFILPSCISNLEFLLYTWTFFLTLSVVSLVLTRFCLCALKCS